MAGVDIWSYFEGSPGSVFDVDQRKREAKVLSQSVLDGYVAAAKGVAPTPKGSTLIVGIFSNRSPTSPSLSIPKNCYLVAQKDVSNYYGIFASHPVVSGVIRINDPLLNQTTLSNTLQMDNNKKAAVAKAILAERNTGGDFKDEKDLCSRESLKNLLKGVVISEWLSYDMF